ncbi:MAG: glycosyltransferase [Clostridia bacterium]|nr:glycosyltransferase [Clostridia bacterium]
MEKEIMLSLIIPVYNEEKNLPSTLPKLAEWLENGKGSREVVLSDDGSVDGSAEMICEWSEKHPGMRLVSAERNQGKGAAVRLGMLSAVGRYRVFTDCDLAYGLEAVRRIEERLMDTGAGAVIGSRALHPSGYGEYSFVRRMMSKVYVDLLKVAGGLTQTDSQCGIKGFSADAAERIFSLCTVNGFAFDLEVLTVAKRLGIRTVEIAVNVLRHDQEASKVGLVKDTVKMLRDVRRIKRLHRELSPENELSRRTEAAANRSEFDG